MSRVNADNGVISTNHESFVRLPAQFITELMPQIDDLAELKVTLFFVSALQQKEGDLRFMRLEEFRADERLMQGLAQAGKSSTPSEILGDALAKAVQRGTLLSARTTIGQATRSYYFLNDERGRAVQQRILAGEWRPTADDEIEVLPARPTLYGLYEENIGVLTPMIAEAIKEAEASFPRDWIEEALRIAVERNARNWRYISKVLERWQQEGRSLETGGRQARGPRSYTTGKRKGYIKS